MEIHAMSISILNYLHVPIFQTMCQYLFLKLVNIIFFGYYSKAHLHSLFTSHELLKLVNIIFFRLLKLVNIIFSVITASAAGQRPLRGSLVTTKKNPLHENPASSSIFRRGPREIPPGSRLAASLARQAAT
jgi:hypothetical protein